MRRVRRRDNRALLRTTVTLAMALGLPQGAGCTVLRKVVSGGQANKAPATPESRRQAYVQEHPELGAQVKAAILEGSIVEGMSRDEVRASVGRPRSQEMIVARNAEEGDVAWIIEQVVFGTRTRFEGGRSEKSRTFSGVRDTRIRFYEGAVIGVEDMGYATRGEIEQRCHHGQAKACERLRGLDALAASAPPGAPPPA